MPGSRCAVLSCLLMLLPLFVLGHARAGSEEKKDMTRAPVRLRGYGTVVLSTEQKQIPEGTITLAVFQTESAEKAVILGSKYLADLQNYGAVSKSVLTQATLEVRHGGYWKLGIAGNNVMVLTAPTQAALDTAIKIWHADSWAAITENAYPKYLDNFDNAALAIWWMPSTKSPEQMQWMQENPVIANLHDQNLSKAVAPNVLDTSGPENAAAQLRDLKKPYRTMIWTGTGKDTWFSWMNLPTQEFEGYPDWFMGMDFFEANGYYTNQSATDFLDNLQIEVLHELMNRWKGDPDLLAWMGPHGEFQLFKPANIPPNYKIEFPKFLREQKHYTLSSLSLAWTGREDSFTDWAQVPFPDDSYFAGYQGDVVDLDASEWKWRMQTLDDGVKDGLSAVNYDDASWFSALRTNRRLLAYYDKHRERPTPMWIRMKSQIPESFLADGQKVYLHLMPYMKRLRGNGSPGFQLAVWINGKEVARDLQGDRISYFHEQSHVDITGLLSPGENSIVIHSEGGRLAGRVFLSHVNPGSFPFADKTMNPRYLDWRDYLRYSKFVTLRKYLNVMRAIDPVRPIKVMTPGQWQSDAFDLFEQYGAYPQLTGESSWYRPMHYKGYAALRNRLGSSEPGGYEKTPFACQRMLAMAFFESQDCHDYGFDFARDFWRYPEVVKWWTDNKSLLKTFGKTNLVGKGVGLLRDTEQDFRYNTGAIWSWDLSRGPLPAIGVTPLLVDGPDLEKGLADKPVRVLLDCATTVTSPALIAAIRRYVHQGGIFIAQFNTGQHTESERDVWPLAASYGLRVQKHGGMAGLTFSEGETLLPSLQGKTFQSRGISIGSTGTQREGAVELDGKDAEAIATWSDNGSMAITRINDGKGAFIMIGTPFYLSMQDSNGVWVNEQTRQQFLAELLQSLGVTPPTESTNNQVWIDQRTSKNGLYQVYFAGALGMRGKNLSLADTALTDFIFRTPEGDGVIDATAPGCPDLQTAIQDDGSVVIRQQSFTPYQIRQYAVIRKNVGVEGPAHWLAEQEKAWYALPPADDKPLEKARQQSHAFAASLGEDGLDISQNWSIAVDPTQPAEELLQADTAAWPKAEIGSWRVVGQPDAHRIFYRQQIEIPVGWNPALSTISLGLVAWREHGIRDTARIWINGKEFAAGLRGVFLKNIPEELLGRRVLSIALDVRAEKKTTGAYGPVGTLYLRKMPKPVDEIALAAGWTELKDMMTTGRQIQLPFKGNVFGLTTSVMVPESWKGKIIRLIVEENSDQPLKRMSACILNGTGYMRESSFSSAGVRVDRYMVPGQNNTIDLFGHFHDLWYRFKPFAADIVSVRLEAYNPSPAPVDQN